MEINVKLTLEEVNAVVSVMAQLPFNQVHELVNKIRNQAIEQIQEASPPEENQNETGFGE
jgi:hypothetical protein